MSMMHPSGGLPTWANMQGRQPKAQTAPDNHDQERDMQMHGVENGEPVWGPTDGVAAPAATGEAGASAASLGEVADLAAVAL